METYLSQQRSGAGPLFSPSSDVNHLFIEICNPQHPGCARKMRRSLLHSELPSFMSEKRSSDEQQSGPRFRLLLSPQTAGIMVNEMPYSLETYQVIAENWHIPTCFPLVVHQHVPVGGFRVSSRSREGSALILKSEVNWPWQFALVVVRVSPTTINCICLGLRVNETTQLADMVEEFDPLALNELLVPLCLLSLTCHDLSKFVDRQQSDLWNVQKETGLYGAQANSQSQDFRIYNFNSLIKRLTSMSDNYSRSLSRVATMQRMLVPIEEILEQQATCQDDGQDMIRSQLQWIRQTITGSEHYIKWFSHSSSGQVKTIYQFTQQYDNYLNLHIVQQSSKDGTNMKIISLVTLVFLPGTFAATLFSTSFFNFHTADESTVVSRWIWLYWLVAALLTIGVLGIFGWMVKRTSSFSEKEAEMTEA